MHAPTLLLSISVFGFLLAGLSLCDTSALPVQRSALRLWSRAMLAIGLSCLLFYLRGYVPWVLSFGLANAVFLGLPIFSLLAHARLLHRPVPQRTLACSMALGLGGVVGNMVLDLPSHLAVAAISASYAVLHGATCVMLLRDFAGRRLPAALADALFIGLLGAAFALRAVRALAGDAFALAPADATHFQTGVLVVGMMYVVGTTIAFFSMVHASQHAALLEAFRRDGLTGVYNRSAFFELAAQRLKQHPSLCHAVVMVDLDRFKQVNDTFGHAGGDAALVHAVRVMGTALRSVDLLGRYGGEEFCLLMSGCDEAAALQLAQRLVQNARSQQVRLPDGRVVTYTLSAGCAGVKAPSSTQAEEAVLRDAVALADAALYRAKQAGRDRALAASSDGAAAGVTVPAVPTAWQSV